jgi:serine-type D-Ala-D-Ala carboxypeptidase
MRRLSYNAITRLQSLIQEYVPNKVPCISLSVWGDVEPFSATWGLIDPETKDVPNTLITYYDLASLTKLYVSTAFLTHVDSGKVRLDTPLSQIIPEFGGNPRSMDGGQDPHTKEQLPTPESNLNQTVDPNLVTFRHLLTHTSGLPAWRDVYNASANEPPLSPNTLGRYTHEVRWNNALSAMCGYPFVSQVGAEVRYSDIGLMLLGEALMRISGEDLDIAIDDVIGMYTPIFNPRLDNFRSPHEIAPTEMDNTWRKRRIWGEVHDENACGVGGMAGHAGLFATLEMVNHFGQQWLNGKYLSPELHTLSTTEQAETNGERRGLGWMMKSIKGSSAGDIFPPETYGHTGFTGTSLFIDPVHRIGVTLLTNAVYYGRDVMPSYELRRSIHTLIAEDLL